MGAIRTLVTRLTLDAADAVKGLKAYDKLWGVVAANVETAAARIEKAAASSAKALADLAAGAGNLKAGASAARTPSARGPARPKGGGKDPLDGVILDAQRAAKASASVDKYSKALTTARDALGKAATAEDRARATSKDLTETVTRNREAMARLRVEALRTGDADGALAREQRALSVATAGLVQDLGRAKREVAAYDKAARAAADNRLAKSFSAAKVAAGNLASSAVQSLGSNLVGAFKGAAKEAIGFESSMADVAKVVDGLKGPNGEITEDYKKMEGTIMDLSKSIALAGGPEGFAKIYAAAGEAGIAKGELDQFAESAAKISVAFGVSAEEAGSGMAKMRSGLGLSQNEVESLAGSMNYLSNNMAVTASQAMEVVLKTGAVGKAAQLSGQEVAGLGAAMIASGAQSDVAATATKNYILALAAGETATLRQRSAFKELGMDAEDVAKRFTGSAEERLKVQQELLTKIGKLEKDAQVSALSNLFGKESLGAISGITGDVDKFTKAMTMATDATAAASSVQNEYNVRSKTTENALQLLKNNVSTLAISFGQKLLPHINKLVAWLTSPEGQEWGKGAVEKMVGAVEGLVSVAGAVWPILEKVGGVIKFVSEQLGIGTTAAIAFAAKMAMMGGPAGILMGVATVGVAAGYKLGEYLFGPATTAADAFAAKVQQVMSVAMDAINSVLTKARDAMAQQNAALSKENERKKRILDAGYSNEGRDEAANLAGAEARRKALRGRDVSKLSDAEKAKVKAQVQSAMVNAKLEYMSRAEAAGEGSADAMGGGGSVGEGAGRDAKMARFKYLDKNRKRLRPSEAKEYTKLSKELDERKTTGGGGGRKHKQTAMDKALGGMDKSVAALLTQGGEEDAGGDEKVADNVLDRSVYSRMKNAAGGGERASIGPGPNITNNNQVVTTTVNQVFPPGRDMDTRIAAAARTAGERAGSVVTSSAARAVNAGGTIR